MSVQANPQVHPEAQAYIDLIAATHRPLFDRLHALILASHPNVTVGLSYKMPVYVLGNGRLHVGVWSHGLSLYGWPQGSEKEFMARHPHLKTSKGTIRLGPKDASAVTDDELLVLVNAALYRAPSARHRRPGSAAYAPDEH